MGYSTRKSPLGHTILTIWTYWPDDTDNEFFIEEGTSINLILAKAQEKWGMDIDLLDIRIDAKYIQTDCLYYDAFDPMDWTYFLRITKIR